MPELPEVETVVRGLRRAGLEHNRIIAVNVSWSRSLCPDSEQVIGGLVGQAIETVRRRAKFILLGLGGDKCLAIHLRMTGKLRLEPAGTPLREHDRVVLALSDGRCLHFNDTRKFGRMYLTSTDAILLRQLGPEPLSPAFTSTYLQRRLARSRRMLKPWLLDQTNVAGLGNIYVDEALWAAGIHPERRTDSLTPGDVRRLRAAVVLVLKRGISLGGTTLGNGMTNFYSVAGRRGRHADKLEVFRRHGEACSRCGTIIERRVVGQRGTHLCPTCQPLP